jgi:hypothetical protein
LFKLDAQLLEFKPQVEEVMENGVKQNLETSALGLSFRVRTNHVGVGLKLECTASIGSVYWQSFQEKIPVSPREQPVSGNWWTGSSSSVGFAAQNFGKEKNISCYYIFQINDFRKNCFTNCLNESLNLEKIFKEKFIIS